MARKLVPASLAAFLFIIAIPCVFEDRIAYGVAYAGETSVSPEGNCRRELSVQIKFPSESETRTALLTFMPRSTASSDSSNRLLEGIEPDEPMPMCLYIGVFEHTKESFLAHISKYGLLRSTLKSQGKWYKLSMNATNLVPAILIDKAKDNPETSIVTEWSGISSSHFVCQGCSKSAGNPILHSRSRRDLKLQSFNQSAARRVLELIVVADSGYIAKFGQEGAISRIQQMFHYVNGAYQTLGLQVVLVKIVSLTANQFNATQDIAHLHLSFNVYKAFNIKGRHDAAILLVPNMLTNTFTGVIANSTFGGSTGGLCDLIFSGGIVADIMGPVQAAWLMVRTIGVLLGFQFDEHVLGCVCFESIGCFMDSRKSFDETTQLLGWSSCSLESWRSQSDATWMECLKDSPNASYAFPPATQCGNGIVDSGEQCDCGPVLTCKSACCDSNTCMFKAGAQCANGACCNSTTCRLKAKGQVCRYKDGACDVAETCDGLTEWCPADDKVADGVQCDSSSYCYNGACKSSSNQCKLYYGSTATAADQVCFTNFNTLTSIGYCSLTLIYFNTTGVRTFRTYTCSIVDSICGLLHCSMPNKPSSGQSFTVGNSTCYSPFATDTASSGIRNNILVPDGVACGSQAMCVNSTCQLVSKFACTNCPNCHGNWNLTQAKVCYCKPGFAPPDCSSAGCGGSVTSQYECDIPTTATATATATTTVAEGSTVQWSTFAPATERPKVSGPEPFVQWQTTIIIAVVAVAALLTVIGGVAGYCIHKNRTGADGNGKQDIYPPGLGGNSYDGNLSPQDRPMPSNPGDMTKKTDYVWEPMSDEVYQEPDEQCYDSIEQEEDTNE